MKLTVKRFSFGAHYTIGKLWIDGEVTDIYTLEDAIREAKIMGETAIPSGTYSVVVDYSEHFQKELPHVLDVPGFVGVRIHPGNTDKDTEGCILVGRTWRGDDFIGESKAAFEYLFPLIKDALESGVTLEVV